MLTEREYRLELLAAIKVALERDGPVRLTDVEKDYLRDVCSRALGDDADPLRIARTSGGRHDGMRLHAEAEMVHRLVKDGHAVRAACEAVGEQLNRDGSKSGAVEKNYRRHRSALLASDRFYADLNANRTPDQADIDKILGAQDRGK